jgi:ABC-type branched-subunit amino acid transport system substrate-binding protein
MTSVAVSKSLRFQPLRRSFLRRNIAFALGSVAAPMIGAQTLAGTMAGSSASPSPMVAQVIDMSSNQQDVSKDFVVGARAAWQEINAAGGLRGQTIRHNVIETDGSAVQADTAWQQLQRDGSCLASFGSCGNALAVQLSTKSASERGERGELAHIAPWLQNSAIETTRGTYPIFSRRDQQIQHALQSMSTVGVDSITVVYQDHAERNANGQDITRIANNLKLSLREMHVQTDLAAQASQISATSVPLVLFVGGTPELVQFTRGWKSSSSLRYIIALADVNLLTAQQMGGSKRVPIIGTQAVPMVTSSLPVVRRYRAALAKYYDEAPTALSLAGYIAARYTAQTLLTAKTLSRSAVAEALAKRTSLDLEGFRVEVDNGKLHNAYVTQSMLSADGRVIG